MLKHMMGYELKANLRNKSVLIWNIIFPIAYLTIFFLAMTSLSDDKVKSQLDSLKIIVEPGSQEELFLDFLEEIDGVEGKIKDGKIVAKKEGDEKPFLIYIKEKDEKKIKEYLKEFLVSASVKPDEKTEMKTIYTRDLPPSIIREVLKGFDSYKSATKSIEEGYENGKIPTPTGKEYVSKYKELKESEQKAVGMNKIFMFSALAYIAFYPIHAGMDTVVKTAANQSLSSMRKNVSGRSKQKIFLSNVIPAFLFQSIFVVIVYGYSQILGVDYGGHHLSILVLLILTVFSAISTGSLIASAFPLPQGAMQAIGIAAPLAFAFISGMMSTDAHNAVMESVPWLHNYNPLGRCSNGLYILFAEGPVTRYYHQLQGLFIYFVITMVLTCLFLFRRRKYESL